jgi:site-specific recombinase XerD
MDITHIINLFLDYSKYHRGYSPLTLRRYRLTVQAFCNQQATESVQQITEDTVRSYLHYGRTQLQWQVGTFILYHGVLVVFCRWCMRNSYLEKNPAKEIEVPKPEKRIKPKLTKQEAMRLLDVVYNLPHKNVFSRCRDHAIFATFLYTGLRQSELLNLRLADVDLENFTIFISQGKGRKDRIIPISTPLSHILTRYLAERRKKGRLCPQFFTSRVRQGGLSLNDLCRLIEMVKKASGIYFSSHRLRHTFATLMLEGGCDLHSLSKMMGHTDIKTTTIYLGATAEHLRAQMMKHPLNITVPTHSPSPIAPYGTLERFNDRAV